MQRCWCSSFWCLENGSNQPKACCGSNSNLMPPRKFTYSRRYDYFTKSTTPSENSTHDKGFFFRHLFSRSGYNDTTTVVTRLPFPRTETGIFCESREPRDEAPAFVLGLEMDCNDIFASHLRIKRKRRVLLGYEQIVHCCTHRSNLEEIFWWGKLVASLTVPA